VKVYAQLCNLETGLCDLNSFQNYIEIKSTKLSQYFNTFDTNLTGSFNFRQFLVTYFEVIDRELNSNQQKSQELIEELIKTLKCDENEQNINKIVENILKVKLINLKYQTIDDLKLQMVNKPLFCYFLLGIFTQKF
jgi:DNA-binding transcriptional regulator GbsR (MarR family)